MKIPGKLRSQQQELHQCRSWKCHGDSLQVEATNKLRKWLKPLPPKKSTLSNRDKEDALILRGCYPRHNGSRPANDMEEGRGKIVSKSMAGKVQSS